MFVSSLTKNTNIMTLQDKISQATTTDQLKAVVESIPLQSNGAKTALARHLNDVFWYIDLDTIEKQKKLALKILASYQ